MLYGLIMFVHVLVCLFLIIVILLQGGRGGTSDMMRGAAAQSLFGSGVATVLTRITGGCAAVFVVTCLSLAYLGTRQGRSIMEHMPDINSPAIPIPLPKEPGGESVVPQAVESPASTPAVNVVPAPSSVAAPDAAATAAASPAPSASPAAAEPVAASSTTNQAPASSSSP